MAKEAFDPFDPLLLRQPSTTKAKAVEQAVGKAWAKGVVHAPSKRFAIQRCHELKKLIAQREEERLRAEEYIRELADPRAPKEVLEAGRSYLRGYEENLEKLSALRKELRKLLGRNRLTRQEEPGRKTVKI